MMKECFYCKSQIPVNALVCPYCTRDRYMPGADGDTTGVGVIFAIFIFCGLLVANCIGN